MPVKSNLWLTGSSFYGLLGPSSPRPSHRVIKTQFRHNSNLKISKFQVQAGMKKEPLIFVHLVIHRVNFVFREIHDEMVTVVLRLLGHMTKWWGQITQVKWPFI